MKRFLLVTLLFLSFLSNSHAQFGLPPAGYFDMIIVFPPEASATFINGIKTSFRANELGITPVTKARLWRMTETSARAGIPAGTSSSYISPTDAVERVRGSTSSVSGGALVQINTNTKIPEGSFSATGNKQLALPIPTTIGCTLDREYTMPNSAIGAGQARVAILDTGMDCNEAGSPVVFANPLLSRFVDAKDSKSYVEYPNARDKMSGHGTAVASIIVKAFMNAGKTNCRIIPIKVLEREGIGTLFTLINGIDYAIQLNVDIINISIVSPDNTGYKSKTPIQLALEIAQTKEILVVSAAGNDTKDIDASANYVFPACATNEGQLVVSAAKCSEGVAAFANYGKSNVDIFAPGVNVWVQKLFSTEWWLGDGTSFSAPMAAGMAAVLRTRQTVKNANALKCAVTKGCTPSSAFSGRCVYGGTISSSGALRMFETCR
jgi:subtilisin family serine protease